MTTSAANGRDRSGRFAAGNRAGPGRPLGSRNRLAEKFLSDVYRQWRRSGAKVLERMVETDPVAFAKIVANILPKEIGATLDVNMSLFAQIDNFNQAYALALEHIGATIDHEPEPELIEANGNSGTD
jgi:hypothetical protein